jgi:hypothetical protein
LLTCALNCAGGLSDPTSGVGDAECNTECPGRPGEACGGNPRLTVYKTLPQPPTNLPGGDPTNFTYAGCYTYVYSFMLADHAVHQTFRISSANCIFSQWYPSNEHSDIYPSHCQCCILYILVQSIPGWHNRRYERRILLYVPTCLDL